MEDQSAETGQKKTVMWLKDFLPTDLPKARILAFDYPSQWAGDPDYTNLRTCGTSLLNEIARDRGNSKVRLSNISGQTTNHRTDSEIVGICRSQFWWFSHQASAYLVSFD
jgi:hypothetical protein